MEINKDTTVASVDANVTEILQENQDPNLDNSVAQDTSMESVEESEKAADIGGDDRLQSILGSQILVLEESDDETNVVRKTEGCPAKTTVVLHEEITTTGMDELATIIENKQETIYHDVIEKDDKIQVLDKLHDVIPELDSQSTSPNDNILRFNETSESEDLSGLNFNEFQINQELGISPHNTSAETEVILSQDHQKMQKSLDKFESLSCSEGNISMVKITEKMGSELEKNTEIVVKETEVVAESEKSVVEKKGNDDKEFGSESAKSLMVITEKADIDIGSECDNLLAVPKEKVEIEFEIESDSNLMKNSEKVAPVIKSKSDKNIVSEPMEIDKDDDSFTSTIGKWDAHSPNPNESNTETKHSKKESKQEQKSTRQLRSASVPTASISQKPKVSKDINYAIFRHETSSFFHDYVKQNQFDYIEFCLQTNQFHKIKENGINILPTVKLETLKLDTQVLVEKPLDTVKSKRQVKVPKKTAKLKKMDNNPKPSTSKVKGATLVSQTEEEDKQITKSSKLEHEIQDSQKPCSSKTVIYKVDDFEEKKKRVESIIRESLLSRPKRKTMEERKSEMISSVRANLVVGLEVRETEGKGKGVFTTQSFQRGSFLCNYQGELLNDEEGYNRFVTTTSENACFMFKFSREGKSYWVDASDPSSGIGRYINHGFKINCKAKSTNIDGKPVLYIVAAENIESGAELIYDYGDKSKEAKKDFPFLQKKSRTKKHY